MAFAYKMSFSTGGLFLNESIEVARLFSQSGVWDAAAEAALRNGILKLPKAASNRRTVREIVNRLSTLTVQETEFLVNSDDRVDSVNLLWVATCRAYKFIGEFTTEVVVARYQTYRVDLPVEAFEAFWEDKSQQHPELLSIGAGTKAKLRQILFRFLRETGIINHQKEICAVYLNPRFCSLIRESHPEDLTLFPGRV